MANGISKKLKMILLDKEIKVNELADMLGVTSGVLSTKLYRDTWTIARLQEVLNHLDCEVVIKDNKTGKYY